MSSFTSRTISYASTGSRDRGPLNFSATSVSKKQSQSKAEEREEIQEEIDNAVSEWYTESTKKANELAERFNKKPRYFQDIFFGGGARMIIHQKKVNPHNAFMHFKSQELRDDGQVMSLMELQNTYGEEYAALTSEERESVVREYEDDKEHTLHIRRPTPRSRIADVSNVARNMSCLVEGLKRRVGVEAFFCIVRNTPEYNMRPQWYFSTDEIEKYLPLAVRKTWDTTTVGMKIEAFAIAGCDTLNLFKSSKSKADHMKREIRDKITQSLVQVTGNEDAIVHWARFEEKIVLHYGVDLIGYTYDKVVNPSELSSALGPLRTLLDALKKGTCKFVKLTHLERKARQAAFNAKLVTGEVQPAKRKRRNDAGSKRGSKRSRTNENKENDSTQVVTSYKSVETVNDSD